jgi:SET domain-containing protein
MLIVSESKIHGRGCFAKSDIPKGTEITASVIVFARGTIESNYIFPWNGYIKCIVLSELSYCNSVSVPNLKILKLDKVNLTKTFIVLEDIKMGEEVTLFYEYEL